MASKTSVVNRVFGGLLMGTLAAGSAVSCVSSGSRGESGPLRISEVESLGDSSRRASTRLVLSGLGFDVESESGRALSEYERAIQIDPTNPFAYLAIARFYADLFQPGRTLEYVDQAELLLGSEGVLSPGVEAHLAGLRGVAFQATGRFREAERLLGRARRLAPSVWSDARLSPEELR